MNFSIASLVSTNFLNLTISKELLNKLRGWREKERNKRKINPEKKKHELVRQRTYRKEERFLGQAFCAGDRLEFRWKFDWIQDMCARTLKCKSEGTNQFQKLFILPIESNCTNFRAHKGKEISTVRSPSRRWTWEAQSRPHLMKTRFTFQGSKNVSWADEESLELIGDKDRQALIEAWGHQNPLLRPRIRTAGFWGVIMGPDNLWSRSIFH